MGFHRQPPKGRHGADEGGDDRIMPLVWVATEAMDDVERWP